MEYTPEGGDIAVILCNKDDRPTITVTNPTRDLTPADVAALFDPFWRKEASRSGGQHFGLGLSLCRTFAAAMSWTLTATLDEQYRLSFQLTGIK